MMLVLLAKPLIWLALSVGKDEQTAEEDEDDGLEMVDVVCSKPYAFEPIVALE